MLNIDGQRFIDEAIDLRNSIYANFGQGILQQPEHLEPEHLAFRRGTLR